MQKQRGRPRATANHDPQLIARRMRSAFYRSLDEVCKRENKALHEVMADQLQKDFKGTVNMIVNFFPKEQKFEVGESLAGMLLRMERERHQPLEKPINGEYQRIEENQEIIEVDPDADGVPIGIQKTAYQSD